LPTGTIATTQTAGNNTTALATTAFVATAVSGAAITALDDVGDVTITSATSGQFLKWNGTAWVNDAIDIGTDTTGSYVASLVAGTGVTLTNNSGEGATPTVTVDTAVIQARVADVSDTEIGYLNGVTSAIQTQIDAKQATLVSATNIKSINGTSILGSGDLTVGAAAPTTTSITANTATTIDSFALATYPSAEYTIQVTQGSKYTTLKALVAHDGTTAQLVQYAVIEIGSPVIPLTLAADISGSDVRLRATITDAATTNATVKVIKTTL
jgi:hypothetical protein